MTSPTRYRSNLAPRYRAPDDARRWDFAADSALTGASFDNGSGILSLDRVYLPSIEVNIGPVLPGNAELGDLSNVEITSASVGDALMYDGTDWVNRVLTEADISDLTHYTDAEAVSAIKADPAWNAVDWDTAFSWGDHGAEGYLPSVADYAALKALTGLSAGDTRYVRSRASDGDGGHGVFVWRSGDQSANVTADPGSGVWVPPTSDATGASGAWERQYTQLDPCMFGAVGDGATDDSQALSWWLSYGDGRKVVADPGKQWAVASPITPSTFSADFSGSTLIIDHDPNDAIAAITLPAVHELKNVEVKSSDDTIDREAFSLPSAAGSDTRWHNVHFEDIGGRAFLCLADNFHATGLLSFKNCGVSSDFDDTSNTPSRPRGNFRFEECENVTLASVEIRGGASRGLAFVDVQNVFVASFVAVGYSPGNTGEALYIGKLCDNVTIEEVVVVGLTSPQGSDAVRTSRDCSNVFLPAVYVRAEGDANGVHIVGLDTGFIDADVKTADGEPLQVSDHPDAVNPGVAKNIRVRGRFETSGTGVSAARVYRAGSSDITGIHLEGTFLCTGTPPSATTTTWPAYVALMAGSGKLVNAQMDLSSADSGFRGAAVRAEYEIVNPHITGGSQSPVQAREGALAVRGGYLSRSGGGNCVSTHSSVTSVELSHVAVDGDIDLTSPSAPAASKISHCAVSGSLAADTIAYSGKEIGSWTPVVEGSSTAGSHSYTTQSGHYTVIDDLVYVECEVELSSLDGAASGVLRITGLPFDPLNSAAPGVSVSRFAHADFPADFAMLVPRIMAGRVDFRYAKDTGGLDGGYSVTDLTSSSVINLSAFYKRA